MSTDFSGRSALRVTTAGSRHFIEVPRGDSQSLLYYLQPPDSLLIPPALRRRRGQHRTAPRREPPRRTGAARRLGVKHQLGGSSSYRRPTTPRGSLPGPLAVQYDATKHGNGTSDRRGNMFNFRQVEGITPAERDDLDQLQRTLYANGRIRREQADILVELHGRMVQPSPAFQRFFFSPSRTTSSPTTESTPRRPHGSGRSSCPAGRSCTTGARSCSSSGGRPNG